MDFAGGSFIFLAFVVLFIVAIAYGYWSVKGSGINARRDRTGLVSVGKDPTTDVSTWGRGSASSRGGKRRMTPLENRTAEAIDATAGAERDPAWRARVGSTVQLAAPVDPARDHVRGPDDAEVTLVEYGEYECPYCKEAHATVGELEERFGDALRLVYRHLPLEIHPHAEGAAIAAEAAARQGRFWEMHDAINRAKKAPTPELLRTLAKKAGLDVERFEADLADPALRTRVREDFTSGLASGANGTPTFFINNVRYDDDFDVEELAAAVEAARAVAATA
jgi:protein-disulfide isomerase